MYAAHRIHCFFLIVAAVAMGMCGALPTRADCEPQELGKLVALDAATDDHFGVSVSVDGDTAVVGAYWDDHAAGTDAGSAYVFVRVGDVWTQQAQLTALDGSAFDYFGCSVALDGDTVVIGAYAAGSWEAGSAYVFIRSGEVWTQQAQLVGSDVGAYDHFGWSVALDGDTAVVGAYEDNQSGATDAGSAFVFVRSGEVWTEQAKLTAYDAAEGDWLGYSVAVAGDTALIGAPSDDHDAGTNAGSAYEFIRSGEIWTLHDKLTAADAEAGDWFGCAIALDGDTAVIGACYDDEAGGTDAGSAYVFERNGGAWAQQAKLTASDGAQWDCLGYAVALDGDRALIGACYDDEAGETDAGSVYVFECSGRAWTQQAKLTASDAATGDWFGCSVAVAGDAAVVGAHQADHAGGTDAGAAYVFDFGCSVGDLNCDGVANGFDIDPFVLALTDPAEYALQYPDCDYMLADVNGDDSVNGFDIDPFVLLLTGG